MSGLLAQKTPSLVFRLNYDNGKLINIEISPSMWNLRENDMLAELGLLCKIILTEMDHIEEKE